MKVKILYALLILLGTLTGSIAQAQNSCEKIVLTTDRNFYVAGEVIQFAASVNSETAKTQQFQSQVLYTELITPEGIPMINSKTELSNGMASGQLTIPENINSGNYYLRTYTRLATNIGAEAFAYTALKIVNCNSEIYTETFSRDTIQFISLPESSELDISLPKEKFKTRESFSCEIKAHKAQILSVGLVPASSFNTRTLTSSQYNIVKIFYPGETRGLSITGKVVHTESKEPVENALVNLTIPGDRDIQAQYTTSEGRFYFTLPKNVGNRDVFLCVSFDADQKFTLLIDNDFTNEFKQLPSTPFHLSEQEKELALKLHNNLQLQHYFALPDTNRVTENRQTQTDTLPFYGTPDNVIRFGEYITMGTLREYFNELPSSVKVRKRKGKMRFIIYGTQSDLSVYNPLVLVDMVALDDMEKILSIPPSVIDRVECIHGVYNKAGVLYGGIVSIFSKRRDYSGINLPNSGVFIDFGFYQPKTDVQIRQGANIPDMRSTQYWQTAQTLDGKSTHQIQLADTQGTYELIVQALDSRGQLVYARKTIEIQ